ncbi:MAG: hypothetical protein K8U57_23185 [Planctomycetes bacterium]|nr:hypothetical protein [Planctomycetota bacterium]
MLSCKILAQIVVVMASWIHGGPNNRPPSLKLRMQIELLKRQFEALQTSEHVVREGLHKKLVSSRVALAQTQDTLTVLQARDQPSAEDVKCIELLKDLEKSYQQDIAALESQLLQPRMLVVPSGRNR